MNPEMRPGFFVDEGPFPMPVAAVLLSPFVNYTAEMMESMKENRKYDLIVSQSVCEFSWPLASEMCGDGDQRWFSPLFNSMDGLCPLFVSTSQHEACWDEDAELARLAEEAGVDVQLQNIPYQYHVFQLLAAFTPEAVSAEAEIVSWMKAKLSV